MNNHMDINDDSIRQIDFKVLIHLIFINDIGPTISKLRLMIKQNSENRKIYLKQLKISRKWTKMGRN